jgi:hypothetical protein
MALPVFIPGYDTEVTIDAQGYTVTGNVTGISASKGTPRKPTFGRKVQAVLSGQATWSLSLSGHVAVGEPVAALLTSFQKSTLLAFTVQVGEDGGATDSGTFTGNLVLSGLNFDTDAEGEWAYSATAEIDGEPTWTPAAGT